jgi:hypothetical protein
MNPQHSLTTVMLDLWTFDIFWPLIVYARAGTRFH